MIVRIIFVVLTLGLFVDSAFSQTLTIAPLPREKLSRSDFLTEGYSGSVALVAGNFTSSDQAARSDDLHLLQTDKCYPLVDIRPSKSGQLYFAISQAATNTTYQNAFLAAQVIRFVRSTDSGSDVAVSRSGKSWVTAQGSPRPSSGLNSNFLGRTAEEFVAAHSLRNGEFQTPLIDSFFSHTADGTVRWHARLPRRISAHKVDGYYSSLDPAMESVWTGLIDEFKPSTNLSYRRLVRSYLISLDLGSRSGRPIVFAADTLGADYIVVRIRSAPGSGLLTDHTFAFGLTSSGCDFLGGPPGGLLSWLRKW